MYYLTDIDNRNNKCNNQNKRQVQQRNKQDLPGNFCWLWYRFISGEPLKQFMAYIKDVLVG